MYRILNVFPSLGILGSNTTHCFSAPASGVVDPGILTEFRDAVDYARKTAWAVQEWQERQLQRHDPQTVLSLITTERVRRRATQLNASIISDLAAQKINRQTPGINELVQAIEKLYQQLADLFFEGREAEVFFSIDSEEIISVFNRDFGFCYPVPQKCR